MGGNKKSRYSIPLTHKSLSTDLAVSLVLVVFLFQGLILLVIYKRQAHFLLQELNAKADEYAVNLSETLAIPMWDYDNEQIRKIGEGYARNNLVAGIRIESMEGEYIYRFDRSLAENRRIERGVEIVHRGQVIGSARIWLSLDNFRRSLAWLRTILILVLAVSLIVIIITTGTLLRVLMRKPLRILQKGIDRVARGDYDYRFDEVRHRELEGIAGRFSEMAREIRMREDTLQKEVIERQRAEEKIRASEARIRAILDAIPDLMFQFDRDGRFVDYRGDAGHLLNSPDEILGRKIDHVTPADISRTFRHHLGLAFDQPVVQVFEYQMPREGVTAFYECRMVGATDDTALAMVRDITDSVTAELEKSRLREQLQRAHKMEALGMLAGGVAHDLNNVLSGLVTYPQLILMKLPSDSPLCQSIQIIQKSGEKAALIVQDLLTLARRGVAVEMVVDLNSIIKDYLKSPEHGKLRQYDPHIDVQIDLADDLLNVSGSPVHLSKTVMNLVINAAEAIADQGRIEIRTENRYIDTPIKGYDDIKEGDYVVMKVTDTGVGMSSEEIQRIFEPFYTKKVMGRSGTGLGMAVVWGTVKDHRGYIDVRSAPAEGTCVSIYLPATRACSASDSGPEAVASCQGQGEHILVVDDMEEQREIAKEMLASLGYKVDCMPSGEAAVEFVRKRQVDLLVLDMIMDPGIDGLETYRRIIYLHPGQKAILTSGFSESRRVREAQSLGAGAYVKKPYRLETIARAIRTELERS